MLDSLRQFTLPLMHEEGYYASERAAKMLGVDPEEVYAMLESGELEGEREEHQDRRDS